MSQVGPKRRAARQLRYQTLLITARLTSDVKVENFSRSKPKPHDEKRLRTVARILTKPQGDHS